MCVSEYFGEGFGGGAPAQGLAESGVESVGDVVEVGSGVHGQVGAMGKYLAQQPVGAGRRSCFVENCGSSDRSPMPVRQRVRG